MKIVYKEVSAAPASKADIIQALDSFGFKQESVGEFRSEGGIVASAKQGWLRLHLTYQTPIGELSVELGSLKPSTATSQISGGLGMLATQIKNISDSVNSAVAQARKVADSK